MKTVLKRIIALLLSLITIACSLTLFCAICNHPSEVIENTVSSFYREPEGSLDVVMIGSSAAGTDYFPSVVWEKQKITSYCMFVDGCTADIYVSVLKEVLSKQPQAVILIDVDGLIAVDDFKNEEDPIRMWIDSMPKNKNWRETIKELCPDTRWERYFPFSRYHRNMTSLYAMVPLSYRLIKKEVLNVRDPMKGAYANGADWGEEMKHLDIKGMMPEKLTEAKEKFLNELLEYCRSNNLKNVMFVDLPKMYSNENNLSRNKMYGGRTMYIREAAEKYGYSVFSYNELDNPAGLVNENYANTLHLNTSGGVRFSEYFADYLKDKIEISEKSAETEKRWNEDTAGIEY